MRSEQIKNIAKLLLSIGIIVLLIYLIRDNFNELKRYEFKLKILYLVFAFVLLLISTIILPVIWYLITRNLECNIGFKQSVRVRLISEIGKYIPGRILGYGYLILYYADAGKDQVKVLNSSLYELYLATFSSFLFYTIIHQFASFELFNSYRIGFVLISIIGILSLHPFFFRKISDLFCFLFKKERIVYKISFNKSLVLLILYLGFWVIFSFAFFIFVKAFIEIPITSIFYLSGSFAISTFAGFLAFFLPAGLGAREGVLVYLLSSLSGNAGAIIISVSSRIWIILVDLVLFFGALISGYLDRKDTEK